MGYRCALCKGKNPPRSHMFPQNSRKEVQRKWMKALNLPQEQEDAIFEEMRQIEEKGNRPRWCTFHFEYDSAGIHFPKYFDPEEGKTAQGWREGDDDEWDDEQGTSRDDTGDTANERRRSARKRSAHKESRSSSNEPVVLDKSIQQILADAGLCIPGLEANKTPTPKSTPKSIPRAVKKGGLGRGEGESGSGAATTAEKTLQSILMEAGLPVPDSLQAKTGVVVEEEGNSDDIDLFPRQVVAQPRRPRPVPTVAAANAMKRGAITVADAKRMGTFVPGSDRGLLPGGATLSKPRVLLNPMTVKYSYGDMPKVIIPKPAAARLPVQCYNHNTMEKYDDSDALRHFKMPCRSDCRSELTVIMNRARAMEEQFDELANSVLSLVQMYKTKTPVIHRPPQSLATIQGRAASVAGPVYGRMKMPQQDVKPGTSLAQQERREKRMVRKEPQRLLTTFDLAGSVRGKLSKQVESEYEDEEDANESEDADDDYKPSKRL